MVRLIGFTAAACLVVAVLVVTHRSPSQELTGPSPAAVVAGAGESTPLATVRRTAEPSHSGHGHRPRHPGLQSKPIRAVSLDVTSYCETGNRTASGVWPRYGMAASNLFDFGTRLRVPGWPVVVTVTDRIGWGSQLDLFSPSCHGARLWGRRQLLVKVIGR